MRNGLRATLSSVGPKLRGLVPSSRKRRLVAVGIVLGLIAGAAAAVVVKRAHDLPDGAALRVGDTVVTDEQITDRMAVLEAMYGLQPPPDEKKTDSFRRDFAKAVVISIVVEEAAEERDLVVGEKSARDTLTKMIATQLDGRDAFVELLREYGASEQDVLEEVKRQQTVDRLFQEVTGDAVEKVTGASVREYFDEHRSSFTRPPRRSIQNIVVADRAQARTVYQRVRGGEDFAALVQEVSLDESTKSGQGKLGFVERSQLEDRYAEEAFSARPGTTFGPVKTRHGWNVGRVLATRPAQDLTFKQVQDQLRQRLQMQRAYEAWQRWVSDEIEDADVQYSDHYRPSDPDGAPPAPSVPPLDGGPASPESSGSGSAK